MRLQHGISLLVMLWGLGCPGLSFSHDFWIMPSEFRPAPGDEVLLELRRGQDFRGESIPRIDRWFTRFEMLDLAGRSLAVHGDLGDEPAGRVKIPAWGGFQIVYEGTPNFAELEPEIFLKYLTEEGLTAAIRERERRGEAGQVATELYSRTPKAIVHAGPPGQGVLSRPAGQTLELVPLQDISLLRTGDTLALRLLLRGSPLADAQVTAYSTRHPTIKHKARTDSAGIVRMKLPDASVWLFKSVHIARTPGGRAQWESFWAALTVEIRPRGGSA